MKPIWECPVSGMCGFVQRTAHRIHLYVNGNMYVLDLKPYSVISMDEEGMLCLFGVPVSIIYNVFYSRGNLFIHLTDSVLRLQQDHEAKIFTDERMEIIHDPVVP